MRHIDAVTPGELLRGQPMTQRMLKMPLRIS